MGFMQAKSRFRVLQKDNQGIQGVFCRNLLKKWKQLMGFMHAKSRFSVLKKDNQGIQGIRGILGIQVILGIQGIHGRNHRKIF